MCDDARYIVVRQRAGHLVKTYATDRKYFVLRGTEWQEHRGARPAMWNRKWEKMELYLALFEASGTHHVLTFADEWLPVDFDGVKKRFAAFLKRTRRKFPRFQKYVYSIEVGHSSGRWHIHFVADDRELPRAVVRELWVYGIVDPGWMTHPVLSRNAGYRHLAKYLTKDYDPENRIPLGRHEWGVARGMRAMLPPPTVTLTKRLPGIPRDAYWVARETRRADDPQTGRSMGTFVSMSWIENDNKYTRACARTRSIYTTI